MSRKGNHLRYAMLARIILGLLVSLGAAGTASAQQWQSTFGGSCIEAAYTGVQPVSTGGYIFTGVTFSPSGNCQNWTSDIYVVKTNANGTLAWSFAYDIGNGTDTGSCIRECANGDFIVTGVTRNPMHAGGCNSEDIFLLRLNPAGGVIWAKTYGTTRQEMAMTVIETTMGLQPGTSAGDFVVSGYTVNTLNAREGYIMRATSTGTLIWDRTYPSAAKLDNEIITVKESTIGINVGNIIAAGSCDHNWGNSSSYALLMVVNGGSGAIVTAKTFAPPGTNVNWTGEFQSVEELKVGAGNQGDIVATGYLTVQTVNGPATEIYVVKTNPGITTGPPFFLPLAQQIYGDMGTGLDAGACVRENTTNGHLIVTGVTTLPGGFGGGDMFLMEIDPNTLQIVAPVGFRIYGGSGADAGFSTSVVPGNGYILAGYTQSPGLVPPMDPQQAYLIKTTNAGVSGCNEKLIQPQNSDPRYQMVVVSPIGPGIGISCTPQVTTTPVDWSTELCYSPFSTRRNDGGDDGISGIDVSPSVDASSILATPNPVKRGEPLQVDYSMPKASAVTITVSDVAGKIVTTFQANAREGANRMTLPTRGWSVGTYILDINGEGVSTTRKIIVGDR
ncbi:MAG: hypothetical protein JWQ98_918 [Chlorobi bacterium]|nr:hypothetical protein [Chlorobiota bacterium]